MSRSAAEPSIVISIPIKHKRRTRRKEIILPHGTGRESETRQPSYQEALVITLARVHRWKRLIEEGRFASITDIARTVGLDPSFAARLMKLTFLAPDIVEAILAGNEPDGLSLTVLTKRVPASWSEQRKMFGFDDGEQNFQAGARV